MSNNFASTPARARSAYPWRGVILGSVIIATGALLSCSTLNRTVVAPPEIAGAQFVGSATCGECHAEIYKGFPTATHARLQAETKNALNIGCEGCHGPGSVHKESGGAAHTIINPNRSPETCFKCHLDKRGEFSLPHAHPVFDGPHASSVGAKQRVSCSDCHNPHKGQAIIGGGTALSTEQETCGKCHVAQRGPFVFEHEAVREGCTTCHKPHGSVNARMLAERNHVLCLKCHFQQQTATGRILIGGQDHTGRLGRGTCWSAGCHEAIHGSQIGSSLRF
jgi:predicted CXXCH cytochrome family protein